MAEKKAAYNTHVKGMERKTGELQEYLNKPDRLGRTVRSKSDKLQNDIVSLQTLGSEYVASLATTKEEEIFDKIYEDQVELVDKANQIIEIAQEFLEEEDSKIDIMKNCEEASNLDCSGA